MAEFDINCLPDLDVAVLAALELFAGKKVPCLDLGAYRRPLVVGSGNAAATGRILFHDADAVFADESTYGDRLAGVGTIDGAVLISASGTKHAVKIARDLKERGIETRLLTCNPNAPAAAFVDADKVFCFDRNREPYTYNTSTYLSMILAKTGENPESILRFLEQEVVPLVPGAAASRYDAFYFLVPARFDAVREMFLTKFDELFGPLVSARAFTVEQTKHAKTVVPGDREMFISLGDRNELFGDADARLNVPLPPDADYGAALATGYYLIGRLQSQYPPYFKDNVASYVARASALFGHAISAIVEQ